MTSLPMKRLLLLLLFNLIAFISFGQILNGSILDKKNGEPLIGATISVKGTSTGASADVTGEFTLTLNQPLPVTLVCSYIGYVTQELVVADTKKLIVKI